MEFRLKKFIRIYFIIVLGYLLAILINLWVGLLRNFDSSAVKEIRIIMSPAVNKALPN